MYVVTFYSFKGGVGRTMALVNSAAEFAKRGQKVLVVDFDLEAPGIATYTFCADHRTSLGVVDYIYEFRRTMIAPAVSDYIVKCSITPDTDISVMPAGRQDSDYRMRFHSIRWDTLYSEESGYLMMEDMKEQWRLLGFDYVLIDSRTGHTDVAGICTRQLPDAVVIAFFPNRQNLEGLKSVVSDVRSERLSARKKNITLHFLASNVPSVDDEDGILNRALEEFKQNLGCADLEIVHYYNNLHLVEQSIFTIDHPRSALAKEYRSLVDVVAKQNPADREGALAYLQEVSRAISLRRFPYADDSETPHDNNLEQDQRLEAIRAHFSTDGRVLASLGDVYERLGRFPESLDLYKSAIALGFESPTIYRDLASLYLHRGDFNECRQSIEALLRREDAKFHDVLFALQLWQRAARGLGISLMDKEAISKLKISDALKIVVTLSSGPRADAVIGLELLQAIEPRATVKQEKDSIRSARILLLIRSGQYLAAMDLIGEGVYEQGSGGVAISDVFNYGMAQWGETGAIPRDIMQRVLDLDRSGANRRDDPNYAQCLALANWCVGAVEEARAWLGVAKETISKRPGMVFSAWRYSNVPNSIFRGDIKDIERLISGQDLRPKVFVENRKANSASKTMH